MGGFSGGKGRSKSGSSSSSFVLPQQLGGLEFLFNQGQSTAQGQLGQIGPAASELSQNLLGQGQGFLSQLQGAGGNPLATGAAQQLFDNPLDINQGGFLENLQQLANPSTDPFLQQQIDFLGDDISTQVGRLLPQVNQDFIQGGTAGGARNQIAQGLVGEAGVQQFAQGAGALRNNALERSLAANQAGLGSLLDAGQINNARLSSAGQIANQGEAIGAQAAGQGLSQLNPLLNLGLSPFGAQFSPLLNLQQILGNPAILNQSQSFGKSSSDQFSFNALKI